MKTLKEMKQFTWRWYIDEDLYWTIVDIAMLISDFEHYLKLNKPDRNNAKFHHARLFEKLKVKNDNWIIEWTISDSELKMLNKELHEELVAKREKHKAESYDLFNLTRMYDIDEELTKYWVDILQVLRTAELITWIDEQYNAYKTR